VGSAIFFVSRATRIVAGLDAEADLIARSPDARRVKPRRANLRAQPSTDSPVLGVLPGQLPVFVEATEGEWALVRTVSGQVGWIHGELLATRWQRPFSEGLLASAARRLAAHAATHAALAGALPSRARGRPRGRSWRDRRRGGDADRHRGRDDAAGHREGALVHGHAESLGEVHGLGVGAGREDRELLAAVAGDGFALPAS
jgi:hypothetical protein